MEERSKWSPWLQRFNQTLFKVALSVSSAMENMQGQVISLKRHIYVAYNQWKENKVAEANLDCHTLMFVEDYQQNLIHFRKHQYPC